MTSQKDESITTLRQQVEELERQKLELQKKQLFQQVEQLQRQELERHKHHQQQQWQLARHDFHGAPMGHHYQYQHHHQHHWASHQQQSPSMTPSMVSSMIPHFGFHQISPPPHFGFHQASLPPHLAHPKQIKPPPPSSVPSLAHEQRVTRWKYVEITCADPNCNNVFVRNDRNICPDCHRKQASKSMAKRRDKAKIEQYKNPPYMWAKYLKPTDYVLTKISSMLANDCKSIYNPECLMREHAENYTCPRCADGLQEKLNKHQFLKFSQVVEHNYENRTSEHKSYKVLGNGEYHASGSNIMIQELADIRQNTLDILGNDHGMRSYAYSMRFDKSDKLEERKRLGKKRTKSGGDDDEYIRDVVIPCPDDDLYVDTLAAVEIHKHGVSEKEVQDVKSIKTSWFMTHSDKAGQLAMAMNFVGISFFFIIFYNGGTKKYTGEFENGTGDYCDSVSELNQWINQQEGTDLRDWESFKKHLKWKGHDEVSKAAHFTVKVYKMEPGARLVFPAVECPHGVLVVGGQIRDVAIFYEFEPISSNKQRKRR